MVQCLGHLTNINATRIDHAGCQDLTNNLLTGAVTEKSQNNATFFKKFNTTVSHAKYDVQVQMSLPANSIKGKKVQSN
eukprot:5764198-Ditylum_brightwellii.AAC.1